MAFEFIQIPAHGQGAAKEELNRLLRGRRVVSLRKEFVAQGQESFWAFCLEFIEGGGGERGQGERGVAERVDYKAILSEGDFQIYNRLRLLRKELAEKEAVPPYTLFTNEQLAEMVRRKAVSVAQLGEIAGVGGARMEKYGAAFLKVLGATEGGAS